MTTLRDIAQMYLDRKEPQGTLVEGTAVWQPALSEVQPCCTRFIRQTNVAYPKKCFYHCQTIEHYAVKFNVPTKELREAIHRERARRLTEGAPNAVPA